MSRGRLLTLTNLYPPQNLGGFGLALQRLSEGLLSLGWDLHVLSSDQPYLGPCGFESSVERSLELLGTYENGIQHLPPGPELERRRLRNRTLLQQLIQQWQPQAALVGNLDLLGLDLLQELLQAGIPTVQHVGFMNPPFPRELYPQGPYAMATASAEVRRLLAAAGFPTAAVEVVYPPLAPEYLQLPLRHAGSMGAPLRIGYCGLLMHSKGVHVLLQALQQLAGSPEPWQCHLAGRAFAPAYEQQLRQWVDQAGLQQRVQWHGFVEPEQLPAFYRQLDVLVFPSLHPESFGMVVAEAMASGVLPLSTGVGGSFEVITHGCNGLLVPPDDVSALANALSWCLKAPVKRVAMAQRAQRDACRLYGPKRSARVLDRMFARLEAEPARVQLFQ